MKQIDPCDWSTYQAVVFHFYDSDNHTMMFQSLGNCTFAFK
jgi:hypothetical protein